MTDALIALVIAAVALAAIGGPLALAATRSAGLAIVLSPLFAGLTATAATFGAILTRSPFALTLGGSMLVSYLLAWWLWRRRGPAMALDVPFMALAIVAALTLPVLIFVLRAPVGWDARTLWLFHAEWITEGGQAYVDAIGNDAIGWAHADYPPLASATAAASQTLGPEHDPDRVGQASIALLTWSALALTGIALCAAVGRGPPALRGVVAGLMMLGFSAFVTGDRGGVASGYVDYLWAGMLGAAAIFLLSHRPDRSALILGSLCLGAAALTKNEAMIAAGILAGLALVRHRHRLSSHWPIGAALVPALTWALLVRALGATSDIAEGGNAGGILTGDPEVWSRLDPTVRAIGTMNYTLPYIVLMGVALVVAVLAAITLRPVRRELHIGSDGWNWLLVGGVLTTLVAAYLASPSDIDWHLATSLDRTLLAPALLLLISLSTWLLVGIESLRRDTEFGDPVATRR